MRELDNPIQDKKLDSIEIRAEQEKKKELKLIGQDRKIRGHVLWEYNKKKLRYWIRLNSRKRI